MTLSEFEVDTIVAAETGLGGCPIYKCQKISLYIKGFSSFVRLVGKRNKQKTLTTSIDLSGAHQLCFDKNLIIFFFFFRKKRYLKQIN